MQTVKGLVGGEGVCGVLVGEVGGLENTAATVSCFPDSSRAGCLLLSQPRRPCLTPRIGVRDEPRRFVRELHSGVRALRAQF